MFDIDKSNIYSKTKYNYPGRLQQMTIYKSQKGKEEILALYDK